MTTSKTTIFVEDDENKPIIEKVAAATKEPVTTDSSAKAPSADANVLYLPSDGKLGYPAMVEYRDMMAGDEEVLASADTDTYARTLNGVLKGVLKNCEFFEKLSLADRDFALIHVWANNYSPVKKIETECSKCGSTTQHSVDLTKLEVKPLHEKFRANFEVELKKTGNPVKVRMNTVADELAAEEYVRLHGSDEKKKIPMELLMLYYSIDIGAELPIEMKVKWIRENISTYELGIIRKYHVFFQYGVNQTIDYACKKCGEVAKGRIPFQVADILYPRVQVDFEDFL